MVAATSSDQARRAAARAAAVGLALRMLSRRHGLDAEKVGSLWQKLGQPGFEQADGDSGITKDGTPFELSVSLGERSGGLRFLAEPAGGARGVERFRRGFALLPAIATRLGVPLSPLLDAVERLLPQRDRDVPPVRFGLWISPALGKSERALKVYVNTGFRHPEVVFALVQTLTGRIARSVAVERFSEIRKLLGRLHRLSFVGVEAHSNGRCRLKLYFRGASWSVPLIEEIALEAGAPAKDFVALFRSAMAGTESSIAPEDLLLSVSLSEEDTLGVKIDVAAQCVGRSYDAVRERIRIVARSHGFDTDPYLESLATLEQTCGAAPRHTLVGLSADRDRPRINVYLKPDFPYHGGTL